MSTVLLLVALAFVQEDSARQARVYVDQLRSDRIEERQEATRKLKALGKAARPELEREAAAGEPEPAARAAHLIRVIEILDQLAPALKRAFPGLEDRLAESDAAWTDAFLEATAWVPVAPGESAQKPKYPDLDPSDLGPLALRAVKGAVGPERKVAVCRSMARSSLEPWASAIFPFLKDADVSVRRETLATLAFVQARDAIPGIVERLQDADSGIRQEALNALARLGATAATSAITELLKDPEWVVRMSSATALGRLKATATVPLLVPLLRDDPPAVRSAAAEALGRLGATQAIPAIARLLDDPDVCGWAALALGQLGAREALPGIEKLFRHEEEDVRHSAVEAARMLGWWDLRDSLPAIEDLLRHEDAALRALAVRSIARLDSRAPSASVAALLRDEDPGVRSAAAISLGLLKAADQETALVRLLKDPEGGVRGSAAAALAALPAKSVRSEIAPLLNESKTEVRQAGIWLIGELKASVDLTTFLKAPEAELREAALMALARRGQGSPHEVARFLKDPHPFVRQAAIWALGELRAEEQEQTLAKFLDGDEEGAQRRAAAALDRIGAQTALRHRLRAGGWEELQDAAGVLRILGDDETLRLELIGRLAHPEPEERTRAAVLLCWMGRTEGVRVILEEAGRGEAGFLRELNALRRREVWDRLRTTVVTLPRNDQSCEEWLERLLLPLGLKLEISPQVFKRAEGGLIGAIFRYEREPEEGRRTVLDELQGHGEFSGGLYGSVPVLEKGRVRMLTEAEALDFWRTWESGRQGK